MSKIIIFGFGGFAKELSKLFAKDSIHFSVATTDKDELDDAKDFEYDARECDIMSDDDLLALGIGSEAEIIFCALKNESENIFLVLSARVLDKNLKIVAHAETLDGRHKLLQAGATKLVDSYELSAHRIVDIITKPLIVDVMHSLLFEPSGINLAEIHIKDGSPLDGKKLSELNLKESHNLIILGVVDDAYGKKFLFSSKGNEHYLNHGDILIVMGFEDDIEAFRVGLIEY